MFLKRHILQVATNRASDSPAASPNRHRRITVIEWFVVAGLFVYLCARVLPGAWYALNTDFPNYYLTARLSREGVDTSRVYEWRWIQRQKDHRSMGQGIVGMISLTPFSTLVVRPLAHLTPLTAKRYWIITNLILLVLIAVLLRRMTYLSWRHIALVVAGSIPLYRNLLYGQYYVLLLFDLSLACWCYLRGRRFISGLLVGFGFGLKIFPVIYLVYFLRKKDVRAFVGGVVGCIAVVGISLLAFGWQLNRTYILEVVPWALRGEGLDPYNLRASSITSLLHRLFIYEPQLNPHPVSHAPWLLAFMHPVLQMAVLGLVLLLSSSLITNSRQLRLEWAAMLLAILTISTIPASYLFTLLILPTCLLLRSFEIRQRSMEILSLVILYCVAGIPALRQFQWSGWKVFLEVPRLYALIGLSGLACILLWRQARTGRWCGREEISWSCGMVVTLLVAILVGFRHQRGLYSNYAYRLETPAAILLAANPQLQGDSLAFVALQSGCYRVAMKQGSVVNFNVGSFDELSQATTTNVQWIEEAARESNIVEGNTDRIEIAGAESPVASSDGKWISFLREERGRANLWLHRVGSDALEDRQLTFGFNVFEMSFQRDKLIFAATRRGELPKLYSTGSNGEVKVIVADESRFPAVSPDGKWLAYSRMQRGSWNLWIRAISTGQTVQITDADCNSVEPVWETDSKTLIYASDCGRSLWATALYKRRIFP
jgi:hypothetical protein